jgi:hypothetical protein
MEQRNPPLDESRQDRNQNENDEEQKWSLPRFQQQIHRYFFPSALIGS